MYGNTYRNVASKCDEFSPFEQNDVFSNAVGETTVSCVNCEHFDSNHCSLDLYDKIVNEI